MRRSLHFRIALLAAVCAVFVQSCGGGGGGATPNVANNGPSSQQPTAPPPVISQERIYTLDPNFFDFGGQIFEYEAGASGDVPPVNVVAGASAHLANPQSVVVDSQGYIYVGNTSCCGPPRFDVTVYAPDATGDALPVRTISTAGIPTALALDRSGDLYVTTVLPTTVEEFAAGTDTLLHEIAGSNTGLAGPHGIAVSSSGRIYVANLVSGICGANGSIAIFAPGSSGNAAPISSISGAHTHIVNPQQIAMDANDNLYVNAYAAERIVVFNSMAAGDATPVATILRSRHSIIGVAVSAEGNIYDTEDPLQPAINEFPKLADLQSDGMTSPIATIQGPHTQLPQPVAYLYVH